MGALFRMLLLIVVVAASKVYSNKISSPGDIIIGGLFPVHKKGPKENLCGPFNEIPGYQYMEAMLYAIDQINNNANLLPNITLGTIIYDTCRSSPISADKTKEFIKLTLRDTNQPDLAGIIGPFVSANSIVVANFLRVFEIPQISYASLTVELSNKELYSYFFRTVPPDSFFAEAIAVLCQRMGWSYVSIIYSTGTYSETGAKEVIKALESKNLCVAEQHVLISFPKPADFEQAMIKLSQVKKANVVIFITTQRDSRGLLQAKRTLGIGQNLSFVGSVSWSNRDDITKDLGDVAVGTLTFGHQDGNIKEFEEYFRSLNLSNYKASYKGWFHEFWEKQFNCSLNTTSDKYTKQCSGNETLSTEHMEIAPVRVVINAVYAMAHALHDMHQDLCPNIQTLCDKMTPFPRTILRNYLKNVTFPDSSFKWPFKFNKNNEVDGNYTLLNFRESDNGRYVYAPVGTWTSKMKEDGKITGHFNVTFSDIRWATKATPSSVCGEECGFGRIKDVYTTSPCCWTCVDCVSNEVVQNNTCIKCTNSFIPNTNFTECLQLPLTYINVDTPLAILLVLFSCLGVLTVTVVAAIFVHNRQHKLLKAVGLEMSYIMLFGVFLVFITPLTMLTKPCMETCYFSRLIIGISFSICYAPLLIKTWRIHQIFNLTARQVRKIRAQVGLRSLIFITVGLITIQGLFCVLIFSTDQPKLQEKFYASKGELVLECSLIPAVFVGYLIYNVVLMFLCTIYAFLTRNFPKNFNEAMHIGVTMYLTCVVWVVFLACFLNVDNSLSRIYWVSGACTLIGWITLLGLFGPKIFQLCMKVDFDEDKLVMWTTSTCLQPSQCSEHQQTDDGSKHDTTSFVAMNPMIIINNKRQ